jgi:isochorismate synthase
MIEAYNTFPSGGVDTPSLLSLDFGTFLDLALSHDDLNIAVWRLPEQQKYRVLINDTSDTSISKVDLEKLEAGFLFHPFAKSDKHPIHFIKAGLYIEYQKNRWNVDDESAYADQEIWNRLLHRFEIIKKGSSNHKNVPKEIVARRNKEDKTKYENLVRKSVAEIEKDHYRKLVPARCMQLEHGSDVDLPATFEAAAKQYPSAFVSLVKVKNQGIWFGATPEYLLGIDADGIFYTTALAGTQVFEEDTLLCDVAWKQKEIEEQALVSRFIIDCFKKIRLREFDEIGPRTIRAGNLLHLKTDYTVDLNNVKFPQLGTVMAELLHPTSAVCGMPKEDALQFLIDNEGFDRAYYSGYLGPVNLNGNTSLFVNLRNMHIDLHTNQTLLFAGAGVTIDSFPEKEWQETEAKMQTLLQVIKS